MPRIQRVDTLDDRAYRNGAEDGEEIEATEVREFSVGGKHYRTYLSQDNANEFDSDMATWTEFAEEVKDEPAPRRAPRAKSTGGGGSAPRRDRTESTKIREWAMGQNFTPPVSDKGRIPGTVIEAYYAAHPEERPALTA